MSDAVIVSIIIAVIQTSAFIGGGIAVAYRIGKSMQRLDQYAESHGAAITELKDDITAMKNLMTDMALQKLEMATQKQAIERLERWYDELRRGEGYVFPLKYPRTASQD